AIARELGDVCVLEKNESYGMEVSSRNSEVIHAGLYYSQDSLKTKLCVEGNPLLRSYLSENDLPHLVCGKMVVATEQGEVEAVERLFENARKNGVQGISLTTDVSESVSAKMALYSATTGIFDVHAYMKSLFHKARDAGALFSFGSEVVDIQKTNGGFLIETADGEKVLAERVINSAGLKSDIVANKLGLNYKLYPCKGDYFAIRGAAGKLDHLVYPSPSTSKYGLGVHATINLQGEVRLGPDTTYVDEMNFDVDPNKSQKFYESALKFLPWLKHDMLYPDTSGIRPKLQAPGKGFADFVIKEEMPGFINLVGIESPGLTASLSIARMVKGMI
ncbi:MAG: NAD(P)/FAD-dependent oxidoreductase, partial [Candidatus Margulisiibacteriota bacterium]